MDRTNMVEVNALTVLVVEDEPVVGSLIQTTLTGLGHKPLLVRTGADALEAAEKSRPDVVLMDIELEGEMDGIETAARLKERLSQPVVYLTGESDPRTVERAMSTDPYGYVVKPFTTDGLRSALQIARLKQGFAPRRPDRQASYLAVLEKLNEGVLLMDLRQRVTMLNAEAQRLTGWKLAESLGQPAQRILPLAADDGASLADLCDRAQSSGDSLSFGVSGVIQVRGGSERRVHGSLSLLREDSGAANAYAITFEERTQQEFETPDVLPGGAPENRAIPAVRATRVELLRRNALNAIEKRIQEQVRSFAVLVILNQFPTFHRRYGSAAAEKLLNVYTAHLLSHIVPPDQLLQWNEGSNLLLLDRQAAYDVVRNEVTTLCSRRIDYYLYAKDRSALVSLSVQWALFPILEASSAQGLAEQFDAMSLPLDSRLARR
ncbi:MAG: response regulator [Bryobacteraceae bacterium]|nr:response regulator [Bryobacteraceae bacterium]